MADRITTYTPETAVEVLRRLNRLEQRQNALLSGGLNQSFPQSVLPTRWARTCTTSDHPTYPTSGNVVMVELGDYEPSPLSPGSTAAKVFTAYDPRVAVEATGDNSPLPFQGQIVPVVWRNGKWWYLHPNFRRATADSSITAGSSGLVSLFDDATDMGSRTAYYTWGDDGGATIDAGDEIFVAWFDAEQRWVILPPVVAGTGTSVPTCVLFNGNAYNGDSSNKNYLKKHNTDSSQTRVGYEHFINGWGDFSGVGCDIMATASSVGAGTHAHTDPTFRLTQGGLYRFILSYDWTDDTTQPSYTTSTLTTSGASAGTAHTHTVDVRVEHSFYSRIKAALQWRNAGGGAWQTTQFQMAGWGDECRFCTDDGIFDSTYANGRDQFVWWQNHNQVDREYRILLALFGSYDSATTPPLIRVIEADSATLAITRLADYAADQTLTP